MKPLKTLLIASLLLLSATASSVDYAKSFLSIKLLEMAHTPNLYEVRRLVDEGANVNYANNNGETAMHAAASRGHLHVIQYLRTKRANMNARTIQNWIPLHHAVRFGHAHVANYLLNSGAPLYMRTRTGQTVFDIAESNKDARMLNLLNRFR